MGDVIVIMKRLGDDTTLYSISLELDNHMLTYGDACGVSGPVASPARA